MDKLEITEVVIYSIATLLFLVMALMLESGFIIGIISPIALALLAFMFNNKRKKATYIVKKTVLSSNEIATFLLALMLIYALIATLVEVYSGVELPGGEWRWGYQFIFFPIIILIVELIASIIGVVIGFILKNKK